MLRRALRRWRRKDKPEEEVFERFAQTFGAAARLPRGKRDEASERPAMASPPDSPLEVLRLAKGASMQEIGAAYRKLARVHHPDKVANEPPEVREAAERRMKEINTAYALLRRRGSGPGDRASAG